MAYRDGAAGPAAADLLGYREIIIPIPATADGLFNTESPRQYVFITVLAAILEVS